MFEPDFEGCRYCGYAEDQHPVESALDDDGMLCEEFIPREDGGNDRSVDTDTE